MKFTKLILTSLVLLSLLGTLLTGCVRLPVNPNLPGAISEAQNGGLPPGGIVKPESPVTRQDLPVKSGSPASHAIQVTINWFVVIAILGGLAACAFGGLAIYSGQLWPGIKLVIGGATLPIVAIWFAYHWLLVIILSLLGVGVYELVLHWTIISPLLSKLESKILTSVRTVTTTSTSAANIAPVVQVATSAVVAPVPVPNAPGKH